MTNSWRTRRLTALVVLVLLPVASAVTVGGPASAATLTQPAVPATGAYFGSSASTRSGESARDAIARTESQLGRKLAVDHQFYKWDQVLPTTHQTWDVDGGRIPFVSWKPQRKDGSTVAWTRIRSGAEDAWIAEQADRIRDFGHPLFMVFNHEPYDQSKSGWGKPADFVAAWQRIVDIFRAQGATNVAWTLVLTGYDFEVSGRPEAFYPGDAYVDWIAADPYNFFTRDGKWLELSSVAEAFYRWGSARGKPLMLAEWGCEEDPASSGRKARWFDNAAAWLEARPNIKAVVYFNNLHDGYKWHIDTSTSSLASFSAMANDSWFNPATGPGTPLPPLPLPAPGATPLPGLPSPPGIDPVVGGAGGGGSAPGVLTGGATTGSGYWTLDSAGRVVAFGAAVHRGEPAGSLGAAAAVDLEPTRSGNGYLVVDDRGRVFVHGNATHLGDAPVAALRAGERVTSLSVTPSGTGYWIFTTAGRVFAFGDAPALGDLSAVALNGPVLDSVATPTGRGYYMVAADGGVFAFGDARFAGSMGTARLNAPVRSLVPDSDGAGYWLVASDGGVFAFAAPFRGSLGGVRLNAPVTGMVRFGNGYLMVGEDGGLFNFSDQDFLGSLGDHPPAYPVVSVATLG